MIRIGLTGGLASGKSTVLRMFGALGVPIIDSDRLCYEITQPYQEAWWVIYEHFGPEYFTPEMALKRKKLKTTIFSDPKERFILNRVIHTRVKEIILKDLDKIEETGRIGLVVVDVPLLFEVRWQGCFDKTLVVYVRPEVQIDRLMKREGLSGTEARRWLTVQMPIDEKKRRADYVIDNNRTLEETRAQVISLVKRLM